MVRFSRKWTREEREGLKLSSLSTDEIPKSVFSYFTKWSDFIAKDASCLCDIQISGSDITIQHLTVYFSHREHPAETRAKMTGKEHPTKTRAKISKAMKGKKRKKHSTETRAKMIKAQGADGQGALRQDTCQHEQGEHGQGALRRSPCKD